MDFPILRREVQNILRKKSTFLFCFLLYLLLVMTISTSFGNWKAGNYYYFNRDQIARQLFMSTDWLALFGSGCSRGHDCSGNHRQRERAEDDRDHSDGPHPRNFAHIPKDIHTGRSRMAFAPRIIADIFYHLPDWRDESARIHPPSVQSRRLGQHVHPDRNGL